MEFTLRKWTVGDLHNLVRYANNRNVSRYLTEGFPFPYTEEDGKAYLHAVSGEEPATTMAIVVNDKTIGAVGVFPQDNVHRLNAEMGYWLAEEYWGRGIMTEAVRRMCVYAFDTFAIERIFARPFEPNIASQKVLEKAGFRFEARFEGTIVKDGRRYDELYYSIRRQ